MRPMPTLKTVGVRELKNRLSEYLREVRLGTTILVTDRGTAIAEIREPSMGGVPLADNSLLQAWIDQGKVRGPLAARRQVSLSSLRLPDGASQALLDKERGA
jgi:antitoxin (DNA-binding transcriptional repressor) of toxin-antitoxin stability system